MTAPFLNFVPRTIPDPIAPTVTWFADTIDELVNFGSNIAKWDMELPDQEDECIPPVMLFRHFMDLTDSIAVLVRAGTGDTAKILARAAMEAGLGIAYMLQKDTTDRSMAFLVDSNVNLIKEARRLKKGTVESKALYKTFEKEGMMRNYQPEIQKLDNIIAAKEELLKTPKYRRAHAELERMKRKGIRSPKWYTYFNGPGTIEELADRLKQKSIYEVMYRKWSGAVHGTDIYLNKVFQNSDNFVSFAQIRYIKDLQEVVSYIILMAKQVFSNYIKARLKHKLPELQKWWLQVQQTHYDIQNNNYINVL